MLSSRHIVEVQLKRQVNLDSKGAISIENQSAIGDYSKQQEWMGARRNRMDEARRPKE